MIVLHAFEEPGPNPTDAGERGLTDGQRAHLQLLFSKRWGKCACGATAKQLAGSRVGVCLHRAGLSSGAVRHIVRSWEDS